MYHYTRMIELLNCLERAEALFKNPGICGKDIRITAAPSCSEGVGVIEAPRGPDPPLPGGRVRRHSEGEPHCRHRPQQHRHEPLVESVAKEYIHKGEVRKVF